MCESSGRGESSCEAEVELFRGGLLYAEQSFEAWIAGICKVPGPLLRQTCGTGKTCPP